MTNMLACAVGLAAGGLGYSVGGWWGALVGFLLGGGLFVAASKKRTTTKERPDPQQRPRRGRGTRETGGAEASERVIREVVVREIVKVRCAHCRALVDQGVAKCTECGAPM